MNTKATSVDCDPPPLTVRFHENNYQGRPGGVQASVRSYDKSWAQQTFKTYEAAERWADDMVAFYMKEQEGDHP